MSMKSYRVNEILIISVINHYNLLTSTFLKSTKTEIRTNSYTWVVFIMRDFFEMKY